VRESPYTTTEVVDLDVTSPRGRSPQYKVKIVAAGATAPTAAEILAEAETDGTLIGPRVNGLAAGDYDSNVKIGTRVRGPIRFWLTT
jgi:hypothetical protein